MKGLEIAGDKEIEVAVSVIVEIGAARVVADPVLDEALYRNRGEGDFDETTVASGMGRNTGFVGWGCGFFDFDLDGRQDLLWSTATFPPKSNSSTSTFASGNEPSLAILYRNLG